MSDLISSTTYVPQDGMKVEELMSSGTGITYKYVALFVYFFFISIPILLFNTVLGMYN